MTSKNNNNHQYSAFHIANTIVQLSKNNGIKTDLLKLTKLTYIVTGYCLYFDFDPFIEDIQAWKYGPVIPSLWHEFKEFSLNNNIDKLALDRDLEGDIFTPIIRDNSEKELDNLTFNIIVYVMEKYVKKDSWDLVNLTHEALSPWSSYKKEVEDGEKNVIIKKEDIKKYYKDFLKKEFQQ